MSVLIRDLRIYGSASMPEDNVSTAGGAVTFSTKVTFVDVTNDTLDYVSDSASDTAVVLTAYGRDTTGVIVNEAKTLTGATVVAGSQSFQRLLKCVASGTSAAGNVAAISHTAVVSTRTAQGGANASGTTDAFITLQSGDGASCVAGDIVRLLNNTPSGVQFLLKEIVALSGDTAYVDSDWSTVPTSSTTYSVFKGFFLNKVPNQITTITRIDYNAASDVSGGSTRNFMTKVFFVNNNTATALTVGVISKTVDLSSGTFNFALTSALNDTATVTNRLTAPVTGVTAFTSGAATQSINVPSPQNLPSGAAPNAAGAQGCWTQVVLTAGLGPANTSETMQVQGQTT